MGKKKKEKEKEKKREVKWILDKCGEKSEGLTHSFVWIYKHEAESLFIFVFVFFK